MSEARPPDGAATSLPFAGAGPGTPGNADRPFEAAPAGIVERHFAEIQALYARAAGGRVHTDGHVQVSASGLPARVVNAANLARFSPDGAVEGIARVRSLFADLGVPFRWHVGATSLPADLPERLAAAGLVEISNSPGMALDLAAMRDEPATVPGLDVREVADAADFEAWLGVCADSFPFDPPVAAAWRAVHAPLGFGPASPLHNYVAWLDGRAVAVSALLYGAETAGIWNVGTLADVRGRGIGREVTLAALRDARAAGATNSVLGSSPMGLPVYTRIGFREVTRIRHFGPAA